MNDAQKEKLRQFGNDVVMNEVVKQSITNSFLKGKPTDDVHIKASRFIALELLNEAWKDIEVFKDKAEREGEKKKQIGL